MKRNALRIWWEQRPAREQRLLALAAAVVGLALVWGIGLAPAWKTVRAYPEQRARLDAQLQTMQTLQAQATALQGKPPLAAAASQAALQAAVARWGARASLVVLNQQATVTLKGIEADALAQFLAQVRTDARLLPQQAQWRREGRVWSGTVTFNLPGG
jgi:general secretion pathway protein M